jgi:cytochrome c oxidase assembly protein subunit 15
MALVLLPTRFAFTSNVLRMYGTALPTYTLMQARPLLPGLRGLRTAAATPWDRSCQRPSLILDQVQQRSRGSSIFLPFKYTRFQSTLSSFDMPREEIGSSPLTTASNTSDQSKEQTATPTRPIIAYHLFLCAAMVYLIIVVGGLTRLTESGLSITEWNPGFKGMKLPWTNAEWEAEWEKYKGTPEWAM